MATSDTQPHASGSLGINRDSMTPVPLSIYAEGHPDLLEQLAQLRADVSSSQDFDRHISSLPSPDSPLLGWNRDVLTPDVDVGAPDRHQAEGSQLDEDEIYADILDHYSPASAEASPILPPSDIPHSPHVTDRPRAPTPSAQSPTQTYDSQHESPLNSALQALSVAENSASPPRARPTMQRSASEFSPFGTPIDNHHNRYTSAPSLPPGPPFRTNLSEKSFSLGSPKHVVPTEALSTPPLPDLPDPNLFPDPYPYNPRYHHPSSFISTPSSGSASTRSSYAYTSPSSVMRSSFASSFPDEKRHPSGLGLDGDDANQADSPVGLGMSSDGPVTLARTSSMSSVSSGPGQQFRPVGSADPNRWSSGSSSWGHRMSDGSGLRNQPSYEWNVVDERDEIGLSTDDDIDPEEDGDDMELERTAAIVIAEEGRGLIVHAESMAVSSLNVQPGTTHLLLASSATPNQIPAFLGQILPSVAPTLLALDISCNFLASLPVALASCEALEELNIASNPLRAIPIFLANLTCLRVLIADSTGCVTLPSALSALTSLHTLSIRRNRLYSIPSWLCLLPSLETLLLDGNPFQGPWKTLVDPLLTPQQQPAYPPNTPFSANPTTPMTATSEVSSVNHSPNSDSHFHIQQQSDQTIVVPSPLSSNAPFSPPIPRTGSPYLPRSTSTPSQTMSAFSPRMPNNGEPARLRKRSGPQRPKTAVDVSAVGANLYSLSSTLDRIEPEESDEELTAQYPRALRKMKSADALGRMAPGSATNSTYDSTPAQSTPKFTSLRNNASTPSGSRAPLPTSFYPTGEEDDEDTPLGQRTSRAPSRAFDVEDEPSGKPNGKWGFLKKMSITRMRSGSNPQKEPSNNLTRASTSYHGPRSGRSSRPSNVPPVPSSRPMPSHAYSTPNVPTIPPITTSLSTTSTSTSLNVSPAPSPAPTSPMPYPELRKQPSTELLGSPSFLAPPSQLPRAGKRRSFLPIDAPSPLLAVPLPASPSPSGFSAFDAEGQEIEVPPRSPQPNSSPAESLDKQREMYSRALRSVMAYLRDLCDLGVGPSTTSGTVTPQEALTPPRSAHANEDSRKGRRGMPGVLPDGTRGVSEGSFASASSTPSLGLRHAPSTASLGGAASSIATSDSVGSNPEEKKYKDDKSKRSMIVKEIVETERTYVKGLQDLVDIYVTPSSAIVSVLGPGIGKDTVIPAAERKIVFNGLESLFTFHKDSFLPSLEAVVAPLSIPGIDDDGETSKEVAKAVAGVFLSHAAFMKMYSTYINNFDNSVQRMKCWTTAPPSGAASPPITTPQASTAHVVTLGLSMSSMAVTGVTPDHVAQPATLSSSQRKRIKTFLKRCRLSPRHTQLNLESYLLLPVQRVPRYRLLLEELVRNTPPKFNSHDDALDRALAEITSLAENMNEGKREAESRRKLVQWQSRIKGKFPSPLVQPHRRLIMDGVLSLARVVRKSANFFEVVNAAGDQALVQVECLALEMTPRKLVAVLCNDLLVLCKDPSQGRDPNSIVELWAVLRMQTVPQPASIVHSNTLRLVDNKAILYFDTASTSEALTWSRAINMHIPASK